MDLWHWKAMLGPVAFNHDTGDVHVLEYDSQGGTMADFQRTVDVVKSGPVEVPISVAFDALAAHMRRHWDGTPTLAHRVTDPGAP
jgi:hypothetical protein